MIELKSPAEIERMHTTGQFVAQILSELSELADVGVNLLDLEHHVRSRIRQRGAQSCYWDYAPSFGNGPFRNVICLSVNDAVLHGLPHDYALRDGDILSMDLAVGIDGWVADAARTVIVGTPADEDLRLLRATEEALTVGDRGREARQPAGRCLSGDRGGRHRLRLPDQHGVRRPRARTNDARGSPRPQQGPRRPRPQAPSGHDPGTRTLVRPHHRPDRLSTPMAGPSARPTARAPPTPSTRSRSPKTAPWCSPNTTSAAYPLGGDLPRQGLTPDPAGPSARAWPGRSRP